MSKCTECKYEYLSECEYPCNICRRSAEQGFLNSLGKIDHFEPKEAIEHDGCDGCFYSFLSEYEVPCCACQYNIYDTGTNYLKTRDCYVRDDKSSNCIISCKKGNKDFSNEDYGFKEISKDKVDMVNHSQHYQHGIEPIDYIESHNLNFNLGNVIKYVSHAPFKGTEVEDLQKAKWYLEREIEKKGAK